MVDFNERLISEFNEAKFQIYRLHNLWQEAKHHRESGNLVHLRWTLDSAAIELSHDAKKLDGNLKDDKEGYVFKVEELNSEINSAVQNGNLSKLYLKLVEKEKLLREIQEESGKGGRYKQEDSDWM